jgi:alkylglycerol monooxygenase
LETYANALLIAMPLFLLLVLFEKWYGWRRNNDTVRNMDMISSLSSGITNVTKEVLSLGIGIISYEWMVKHMALTKVPAGIWTYIVAIVAIDFAGYWGHRLSHKVNFFWNLHIIHHSSEEFNLACALRQSISNIVHFFTIFLLPSALLGVPVEVIAVIGPIHLFAQFWYHTRHINKMGFLEKILVTPSHHRVHHALNPEYIDKNLSQIFIIWDKLFGTFQEELPDKPPVYGITRPVSTWNPVKINFQHLWLLILDAWRTRRVWDKMRIWFMPTGWRPADVTEKYPVNKIGDVYNMEKYNPAYSRSLLIWSWVQISMTLLFITYLFANLARIGAPDMFVYGALVFISVYAYTELMDRNRFAWIPQLVRDAAGLGVIFYTGDWFQSDTLLHPSVKYLLAVYFGAAILITAWFVIRHAKEDQLQPIAA